MVVVCVVFGRWQAGMTNERERYKNCRWRKWFACTAARRCGRSGVALLWAAQVLSQRGRSL